MITKINELKTLTKNISCECKCQFDDRKCNSNQKWNKDKCRSEYKNLKEHQVCKKGFIWNPPTFNCKNVKYSASIIDDSVIRCHEIIEETKIILSKTVPATPFHQVLTKQGKLENKKFLYFT